MHKLNRAGVKYVIFYLSSVCLWLLCSHTVISIKNMELIIGIGIFKVELEVVFVIGM